MRKYALALLAVLSLAGCGESEHEDLRQWMTEQSRDMRGRIPPLPGVQPYHPVPYDALALLAPFDPEKLIPDRRKGGGLQPDLNRRREELEKYTLESISMVGTLTRGKHPKALVMANRALHEVGIGNYMGQNFGVIIAITEQEISLKELVQDALGDWVERISSLQLQGQEGGK